MKTKKTTEKNNPQQMNFPPFKWLFLTLIAAAFSANLTAQNRAVINFDLKFGILKGGEANLIISDTVLNGKKAIHYFVEGNTTGLTDKVYKVHDIYESVVDSETNLPLLAIRNIKEKKYRYYNEVNFFRDNDSIYSERTGGMKVEPNLTDIISVFFYIVKQDYFPHLEKGKPVELKILNGHEILNMKIKNAGEEVVETNLGDVLCYRLVPEMDKGKVMKRNDGLSIYISKDTRFPVLIEIDMRVGTLRAVLSKYTVNGVKQDSF